MSTHQHGQHAKLPHVLLFSNAHGHCRSRGGLDEDEDAYLVPSDWEDDADDEDYGTGGGTAAAKRARERLGKLNEVTLTTLGGYRRVVVSP